MPPLDYTDSIAATGEVSSSILGHPIGFTLATVADFGTSIWNSLPFTPEVSTQDLLARVDKDALQLFNEHPDAVHTASLIGGSLAPGGLALKLLGRYRSGASAIGYTSEELGANILGHAQGAFTGGRQVALKSELESAVRLAGTGTSEYKKLSRQLLIANSLQQVADNALIELAVVGSMNAHPYMEDYLKDPVSNFSLSMAVGGVLGVGFAIPMSNRMVYEATGHIMERNVKEILDKTGIKTAIYTDMTNTSQYQRATANIKNYQELLDSTRPENKGVDPIRAQMVQVAMLDDAAAREAALVRMFPAYKESSDEIKTLVNNIASDPNMVGVDVIKLLDMDKINKVTAQITAISPPGQAPMLNATIKAIVDKIGLKDKQTLISALKAQGIPDTVIAEITGDILPRTMITPAGKAALAFVRFNEEGKIEVFNAAGARNAAIAADIKDAQTAVNVAAGQKTYATVNRNFPEENLFRSTSSAQVNLAFIKEIASSNKLSEFELAHVLVDPTDLPKQAGLLAKFNKMTPDELEKVNVKVTTSYPQFKAQQQFLERAVGKDYIPNMIAAAENRSLVFANQNLSQKASTMIDHWIHGGLTGGIAEGEAKLRRAFDNYFRKGVLPAGEQGNGRVAEEIWNAGAKFREAAKKLATADGYVYLARGLTQPVRGGFSVESFSTKLDISKGFGPHVNYFEVHVDNIIGTLGSGPMGEAEVLVANRHHTIVGNIPIRDATKISVASEEVKKSLNVNEFYEMHTAETQRQATQLLGAGFSAEEVSARLNVTKDALYYIQGGGDLLKFLEDGKEWRMYKDFDKVKEYLSPTKRMGAVIGSTIKNIYGEVINKLDNNAGAVRHQEMVEQLTYNSNSAIATSILDTYAAADMRAFINKLQNGLAEANNAKVGDPKWQSGDNALRRLEIGPIVTFLGKQLIYKTDELKRKYLEPISAALLPLKDKPVGLIELNDVMNTLAGLKGWRDVVKLPDGTITIVQKELKTVVDPVTGKTAQKMVPTPIKDAKGNIYMIKQEEVYNFLQSTRELTSELYKMHNLNKVITGQKPLTDLGFWLPPINLVNKNFAFVIDPTGKENVRLLVATKGDELASLIANFEKSNPGKYNIVPKADQANYNILKGYTDYEAFTTYANVAMQHRGSSALAQVPLDDRMINNIMQGYENLILQSSRKYAETYLSDTMQWLDKMSSFNRRFIDNTAKQPKSVEFVKDSAITIKNILLGRDQLEQSPTLKKINTLTDTLLAYSTNTIDRVIGTFSTDKSAPTKAHYDTLNKELSKIGITRPILGSFQDYLAAATPQSKDISHSVISAGNGLTATLMLRLFEVAQPLVNVLSLPILMSGALMEKLPKTVINANGDSMVFPIQAMYDGAKAAFNPHTRQIADVWDKMGLLGSPTRQFTDVLGVINQAPFSKLATEKALDAINGIQEKAIIKDFLAKPADWAETFTREIAMHTGFLAARRAYPGISDMGATIMATNFMDRAIGNYTAAQRPTLFQGSFGASIGLFQTYFLTLLQSTYRGLENRNFKQLAAMTMAQTGLFGISSWPGFNLLSENIVAHFSDQHYDLTTGTYRAVGDNLAEMILYGLPSSLGPALYTRGDISPRIPSSVSDVAMVSGLREGYSAAHTIISKVAQGIPQGQGIQGLFEGLSLQTLNRPIARWSELVTGHSITRQENTVSSSTDVWTPVGIAARVLGTRPLEEQVARNAVHLNAYYESYDHDRRQAVMGKIKTAVRNGTLTNEMVDGTALEYIRAGGTSRGWKSAINQVLIESPEGSRANLLNKLRPDSPLNLMLQDLY